MGVKTERDFWVYPAAFRDELCRGLDHRNVAKVLHENDFLPGTAAITRRIPGGGTRKVYVISGRLLGDGPETTEPAQSDEPQYTV